MAVSDADIKAFVAQNLSNPQAIKDAMAQYGVSPERLSAATGYSLSEINSYFAQNNIALAPTPAPTPAPSTGIYDFINSKSTAAEVANAYQHFAINNGGDTPAVQAAAKNFLQSRSVGDAVINGAYDIYKQDYSGQTAAHVAALGNPATTSAPTATTPPSAAVGRPAVPNANIAAFVERNKGNPQAIKDAMAQYGVGFDQLSEATGYSTKEINDYFASARQGNLGLTGDPSSAQTYTPTTAAPAQQASSMGYSPTSLGNASLANATPFAAAQTGPAAQASSTGYSPTALGNAAQASASGYSPTALGNAAQASASGYSPTALGNAAQASASGYSATRANLGLGLQSLGSSDPTQANAQLLSGEVNNPYLDAQADNITKRLNRNLQENQLPGIGQGAAISGQYGGSRQGIAQGKAIGDTNDNLANALTNMYGSANEAAQGRMAGAAGSLSSLGASIEGQNAAAANQAAQFGASANNAASLFNAGAQNNFGLANQSALNQAGQYNAGLASQNSQFNAGAQNNFGLANQSAANQAGQYNAGLASQNSQFNAGAQNNFGLANQSAANQAGQYNAGLASQNSQFNAGQYNQNQQFNTSAQNAANAQNSSAANNMNQFNAGAQNNFGLANQSAANQAAQFGASASNAASLYNAGAQNSINQYNAGLQNQAGQFNAGQTNSYNLGLRSNDLAYANLDANIAQNNFSNQLAGANFGLNVYNTLGQQNNTGTQAATNIQNAPIGYQNNFGTAANAAGGQGGTTSGSTLTQSNPYLGALAGAQMGNAWQYPQQPTRQS